MSDSVDATLPWLTKAIPADEFASALAASQRIYDFVLSVLPPETHPV